MSLAKAVEISRALERPDVRPDWLRVLPHAQDADSLYYRALFEWARSLAPGSILEIGTDRGWSAAHLAAGAPHAHIATMDLRLESAQWVAQLPVTNITSVTANSADASAVSKWAPFDMVFVDGNHTFNQAYGEYALYRPMTKVGGLILFDDLALDMKGDEMGVFWDLVVDEKVRLDHLHHTGFGICEVGERHLPPWQSVIGEATRRMSS